MNFYANKQYPKPEVEKENIEYAKILLEDYAGDSGEDSAIHLYIFQNLVLNEEYPKIANDLLHIAITEMHHLKLLGKTIKLLGLSPEFSTYQSETNKKRYWSSKAIKYYTSLKEILELNIKKEQDAINQYHSQYQEIQDLYVRDLLLRILEDENIHLEYFQKQLMLLERNME